MSPSCERIVIMNGTENITKNSNAMFNEFFRRSKLKMFLIRVPGFLLLIASVPCLNGNFGWLTGMQVGWCLLVAALIWFGISAKLEVNGKRANAEAEPLLADELTEAQNALAGCPLGDSKTAGIASAQFVIGDDARVRKTGAARHGYLSSVVLGSALAFGRRSGGLWIYRSRRDIVSGEVSRRCELISFDEIDDIKVTPVVYGEKNAVFKKLVRFDITVGDDVIWLLFDEDFDSKRTGDELLKLVYKG